MSRVGNIAEIQDKLEAFIKKYYKGKIIRRGFIALALILLVFLLFSLTEHMFFLSEMKRTIVFYSFLFISICVLVFLPGLPILAYFNINRKLTPEKAAILIGEHFPGIKDKLLNILQLYKSIEISDQQKELIIASIDQKSLEFKPFRFSMAVNIKRSFKTAIYFAVPLAIIILLLLFIPETITKSTERIVNYKTHYQKPLPFSLKIMNKSLNTIQNEDYTLDIMAVGDIIPAEVFVEREGQEFRMSKGDNNTFHYTFHKPQKKESFTISSGDYQSETYFLSVFPKPVITSFDIKLNYPNYTGEKDKSIDNNGNFSIPEGTKVSWNFYTKDVDTLGMIIHNKEEKLYNTASTKYEINKDLRKSTSYKVFVSNKHLINPDTMAFSINVIPDDYPQISVQSIEDTINNQGLYFQGIIQDDYGFSGLNFFYSVKNDLNNSKSKWIKQSIAIRKNITQEQFFHFVDFSKVNLSPGDEMTYYFEVKDNDAINGAKATKTEYLSYMMPTKAELKQNRDELSKQIAETMENSLKDAQKLQEEINQLRQEILNKDHLGWQEKKKIQDMLKKKDDIQNQIEKAQKNAEELRKTENKIDEPLPPQLLQKQMQLEKLMEELMTDEMKQLMEEIQQLMDELNPEDMAEKMEQMELNQEALEKELDRNLDIFKQLEFEKDLNETIQDLEEIAKEQEQLAQEADERKTDAEELAEKQNELNEKFDDLQKDMEELKEKNAQLEEPNKMPDTQKQQQQIQEEMQNASNQLSKDKKKKAQKSQQNAAQQMKQMAQQMMQMQMEMQAQQNAEDARALRQILDNLVEGSFRQENIIVGMNGLNANDPKFIDLMKNQFHLQEEMKMVEDSLFQLSKRQPAIQSFVNKEISAINGKLQLAVKKLQDRKTGEASSAQQYAMTSINNLALMLAEVLEQMENQNNQNMGASSACSSSQKPQGKPSKPGSMKQMQKQLGDQLKKMQDQLKKGKQQGKGMGGKQNRKLSEQFARMAAEQAEIRRQMQQYLDELKKQGQNGSGLQEALEGAEQLENDLIHKILTEETFKRQQEILTRLLKAEQAEMEREKDDRRESNEAAQIHKPNSKLLEEFLKKQREESEMLRTVPIEMKPFYKNKANQYFFNLNEELNKRDAK